jgi:hypothetical protein
MAVRTSTQAGNLSNSATWGGSSFADGDQIVATHAITVDVAAIFHTSPIGVPDSAPSLAIAAGGSLAAQTWRVCYSHVGSDGSESARSLTANIATTGGSPRIVVTLPALPTNVASYNVYMSSANGGTFNRQLAAVGAGAHNIDTNSTATPFPTSVYAIRLSGGGRLAINANATIRGPVLLEGTTTDSDIIVTQAAGVTVEFDASGAVNNDFGYLVITGTANGRDCLYWQVNGTSGSRCAIRSNAGGGNTAIGDGYGTAVGDFDGEYCDIDRIGTANRPAILSSASAATFRLLLSNVNFLDCGELAQNNSLNAASQFSLVNVTHRRPLGTHSLNMAGATTTPSDVRQIKGCVFEGEITLGLEGMVLGGTTPGEENIFLRFPVSAGNQRTSAAITAFLRKPETSSTYRMGDWDECMMVADGSTYDGAGGYSAKADLVNVHWSSPLGGPTGTYRVDRSVFESFGSDEQGDVDYGANNNNYSSVFEYCLGVPCDQDSGDPFMVGTLATLNGGTGVACKYNHNTWYSSGAGAIALAEGGSGFAGMLDELQSNILWAHTQSVSSTSFSRWTYCPTAINNVTTKTANMVNHAKVDYNCRYRTFAGSGTDTVLGAYTDGGLLGKSYHHYDTTGNPIGANDLTEDPQFVDDTRRFWTWVRDELCGGTHPLTGSPDRKDWQAYGLYLLSLKNEPLHADYNADATFANYKAYVRAGFAPTNVALQDSGHDSVTRGAVEGVFGSSVPTLDQGMLTGGLATLGGGLI